MPSASRPTTRPACRKSPPGSRRARRTPESAAASLPLGLAALIPEAREASTIPLKPGDRLLFYTDGVTEARDRQGTFYPLERSGALLSLADLGSALDQLIEDVLRHVGHTLQDDAAILLIGLGQPLPGTRHPRSGTDTGSNGPLSHHRGHRRDQL